MKSDNDLISASLDFSAIFQFALIFDHFPEMEREKSGTFFGSAAP
jgi:hypothetical protein